MAFEVSTRISAENLPIATEVILKFMPLKI
jgi:hypothetical protein